MARHPLSLLALALARGAPAPARAYTPTPHGCIVAVGGAAPFSVELAVEGEASFRVSVVNGSAAAPAQIATPMVVAKAAYAKFSVAANGNVVTLSAPTIGSVSIDSQSGAFALAGPDGAVLTRAARLLSAAPAAAEAAAVAASTLAFAFSASPAAAFLGSGTNGPSAQTMERTKAQAQVFNTGSWTPSFWSSDGWSMLAVSPLVDAGDGVHGSGVYGVSWASAAGAVTISVLGASADLYLSPAADLRAHVTTQAALEGRAALLPRYAFAFWACRWGWVNQSYIEGVLAEFRSGAFPLDNMISDFEWPVQSTKRALCLRAHTHPKERAGARVAEGG